MTKKILTYIDHFHGNAQASSWEALGLAAKIAADSGGEAAALILGDGVKDLANQAFHYGADQVFLADDPILKDFRPEPLAEMITIAAKDYQPDVIIFPTTTRGRTLAGMAAVDLETGVMVDVIELDWKGDKISAIRPIYAGKLLAKLTCSTSP
ncbi:MAG: hypothetical protein KAS84_03340, partial [Anaerolineales bacterium]|nr:hypothetical protein [Anaerolineales bacterium]